MNAVMLLFVIIIVITLWALSTVTVILAISCYQNACLPIQSSKEWVWTTLVLSMLNLNKSQHQSKGLVSYYYSPNNN